MEWEKRNASFIPRSTRAKSFFSLHKIVVSTISSLFSPASAVPRPWRKQKVLTDCEATYIDTKYFMPRAKWLESYLKFSVPNLYPVDLYLYNLSQFPKELNKPLTAFCTSPLPLTSVSSSFLILRYQLSPFGGPLMLCTHSLIRYHFLLKLYRSHNMLKNKTTNKPKFVCPVLPSFCNPIPLLKCI